MIAVLFQCSPTSRVGVNLPPFRHTHCQFQVSVLSDEPCWGQLYQPPPHRPPPQRFSALRRAVLGSISKMISFSVGFLAFQCSPTSRVGVNFRVSKTGYATMSRFQCSPTSRVGVNSAHHPTTVGIAFGFQCSPTSRVGVNPGPSSSTLRQPTGFSALRRAVLGSITYWGRFKLLILVFQCSPTSRVGVNAEGCNSRWRRMNVSVLSDEPCWGQ